MHHGTSARRSPPLDDLLLDGETTLLRPSRQSISRFSDSLSVHVDRRVINLPSRVDHPPFIEALKESPDSSPRFRQPVASPPAVFCEPVLKAHPTRPDSKHGRRWTFSPRDTAESCTQKEWTWCPYDSLDWIKILPRCNVSCPRVSNNHFQRTTSNNTVSKNHVTRRSRRCRLL